MSELVVTGLWKYPVKGMAGSPVAALWFDRTGPRDDRRWMVVDAAGQFVSQRKHPLLGQFKPSLIGQTLTIESPEGDKQTVSAHECNHGLDVTVWSDTVSALMAPDNINEWLSNCLSTDVRLVRYREDKPRHIDPDYGTGQVGFADGFPLLVCHEDSLAALNETAPVALDMQRFRPNIVVSGGQPWAEREWCRLRSEEHVLELVKPCGRCSVITIEPGTQTRNPEVLKHLLQQSSHNNQPVFGQNAVIQPTDQPLVMGEVFAADARDQSLQAEPV